MEDKKYVIAIDMGTTSVRTIALDLDTNMTLCTSKEKIAQYYPQPGWVEQDALEILYKTQNCLHNTLNSLKSKQIYGIGVTNQRETIVAWNKKTGKPLYNAILWQCRRTNETCKQIRKDGKLVDYIQVITGLNVGSYFSATKIAWLLNNVPEVQSALKSNNLCIGTLDSFIIFHLTGKKVFVTDHSNASRTMLYNLHTQDYDEKLLKYFGIPREILPSIIDSDACAGEITLPGYELYLGGILGDQQASLLGQGCLEPGNLKTTFGTGAFMLENVGNKPLISDKLITTVAWKLKNKINYALEGNMYSAGGCITWIQNQLHMVTSPAETEELAASVDNCGGVFFVPALSGLGAPFWLDEARAQFTGISLATTNAHVIRAVLHGICYNTRAVYDEMKKITPTKMLEMRVDGGMTKNNLFMQFQSDIIDLPIVKSKEHESTAIGACYASALCFGAFKDLSDITERYEYTDSFAPSGNSEHEEKQYKKWLELIKCLL